MNTRILNHIITLTAAVAVVRWWSFGGVLWWIVLALMFGNWFIGATAEKAVEIEAKDFVVRFWRRLQLFTNAVCFFVSIAVVVQSFRGTP